MMIECIECETVVNENKAILIQSKISQGFSDWIETNAYFVCENCYAKKKNQKG